MTSERRTATFDFNIGNDFNNIGIHGAGVTTSVVGRFALAGGQQAD